jgi:hypothetical protein
MFPLQEQDQYPWNTISTKNSKNTQIEETKAKSFLNRKPAGFIIEQESS